MAVCLAGSAGGSRRRQPLGLSGAKSRLGHAETGAGALGMLHVALQLGQLSAHGITHLRTPNPYVVSMLAVGAAVHMPRQGGPSPHADAAVEERVMGVSSFAFQVGRFGWLLGLGVRA